MRQRFVHVILLLFCLNTVLLGAKNSQDSVKIQKTTTKRIYTATRLLSQRPVIDGKLDDACWKSGLWAGDYIQWIPKEGAMPSQKTEFMLLYDDKNIYIAIRAFDNESNKISRKAGRRDELIGDAVGVCFDSYHDYRTGFDFSVTAAGQKIDDVLTNPAVLDLSWNPIWYVKTSMEDSAWVAEYEIPLSQLRYSNEREQVWGFHAWRWVDRFSEESDWEPQTFTGPGMIYLFGELHGIRDLKKSRRIEIMPYTLGKLRTYQPDEQNPFANKGYTFLGNVGLDAKIGLSSNFTADLTLNPDFGQVESDPSVMNLTAFETFYEEKRPFFLEGKNIFKFELGEASLFYSRRIGHTPIYKPELSKNQYVDYPDNTAILSAVKISGKTANGLSIGVLQCITNGEEAHLSTNGIKKDLLVEPFTSYTVGRVQQDFNDGTTTVGGIVTATNRFISDPYLEFQNRNAYTFGVDLLHQWNQKEFFVDAKFIGSIINGNSEAIRNLQLSPARYYQRPDANYLSLDPSRTSLSGQGGSVKIGKGSKGLWRYSTAFNWRSPGLDLNDIGFMHLADIIEQKNEISYFVNKPVSIFRTYSVALNQSNNWDFGVNYMYSEILLSSSFEFLNCWGISPYLRYRNEGLDKYLLRGGESIRLPALFEEALYLHTDNAKKIIVNLSASHMGAQHDNYKSSFVEAKVIVIPFNVLKLSVSANYSEVMNNLQYVDTKVFGNSKKYILAQINQKTLGATFRVDYNITPEISIQYYGSPFASVGKYSKLKEVVRPNADSYAERFTLLNSIFMDNAYQINAIDNTPAYSINNPDFTFNQFRSNLVFRWEYKPGSQLFFIYGDERTSWNNESYLKVWDSFVRLNKVLPTSIFLIKLSYWFSL